MASDDLDRQGTHDLDLLDSRLKCTDKAQQMGLRFEKEAIAFLRRVSVTKNYGTSLLTRNCRFPA